MSKMNILQERWPWWRWTMLDLNILALFLSLLLSWHFFSGAPMAGCGGGSPCDEVLSSRWSLVAGILPVSGLAVGVYLSLLVALFTIGTEHEPSIRRLGWSMMLLCSGAVAGAAVWFTLVQHFIIGEFCLFCMSAHLAGLILAIMVLWRAFKECTRLHAFGYLSIGVAFAVVMAFFQFRSTPATVTHKDLQQTLSEADVQQVPLIGRPDAPYVVTLLYDYQCAHCQKIHLMLPEAIRQYDGKLAFVLTPTPLEHPCNPYVPVHQDAFRNSCELAELALAVWLARRDTFPAFEDWMFASEPGSIWRPRSVEAVRAKATEWLGRDVLDAALSDPWIDGYLQHCVRIFGQTLQSGRGGIPKMIYGSGWVIPEPYSADDLVLILQNSLGVPGP